MKEKNTDKFILWLGIIIVVIFQFITWILFSQLRNADINDVQKKVVELSQTDKILEDKLNNQFMTRSDTISITINNIIPKK